MERVFAAISSYMKARGPLAETPTVVTSPPEAQLGGGGGQTRNFYGANSLNSTAALSKYCVEAFPAPPRFGYSSPRNGCQQEHDVIRGVGPEPSNSSLITLRSSLVC
jgi:hypothetical protein